MSACSTSTSGVGAVLRLERLVAGYRRTRVLDGIDLELGDGDVVALIGRNGVGKSTLLKALIGAIPTTSGRILLDGEDVSRLPAHVRARRGMGYVPQGRQVFPALTVLENLRVGACAVRRADWRRTLDEVLDEYPLLAELRNARAGSLSGGQQQILALVRALVTRPRILLLDEPSEGIQPSIVDRIAETVERINRERGISVVLVEQNLDFAADIAERAYVLEKGRIVQELPMREVVRNRELQREYLGV
jgi:urea ABC transporter ATP-binding protein UrtE